jgi:hypothetical protein
LSRQQFRRFDVSNRDPAITGRVFMHAPGSEPKSAEKIGVFSRTALALGS